MSRTAPTPEPLALPERDDAWAGWLEQRARTALADVAAAVAALREVERGDAVALEVWNDVQIALATAVHGPSLLVEVHPDAEVRALSERLEREGREVEADLLLDEGVYAALASLEDAELDPDRRRVLDLALLEFRRGGIDLDEPTRERLREVNRRVDELTQDFTRVIRDGRRTTRVPASALDGLPEDYVAEHPVDADGMVEVTTAPPDTVEFLTHSRDADARRAVAHAHGNLGWPENDQVLADLLEAREQKAQLLGHPDWPSFAAEVLMIGSGRRIAEFIEQITEASEEAGHRDLEVLLEAARADGEDVIDTSNMRHYLEAVRREDYGVDAHEVRRYFDHDRVVRGVLDVTGRLFGLRFDRVEVPVWHDEVTSYDVVREEDGHVLGRVHLDLVPREGKFNHAAQFSLVPGVRGRLLAETVLVCNFPRGLLTHGDVVTLFHEFGHLLHHVIGGGHDWVRFSGVATEWDFVEAPSQMLERWAWDATVLREFALDEDGNPIPEDLVARMRAADEFAKGFHARTQMGYAAVSYWLHQDRPADLTEATLDLLRRHSLITPLPDTHFHAGFGHLEGYTSGYYTYMWSLVIAKDLFSAFDPDDMFAPEVARRYRDTVLAAGGSRDAADLVESFLGRPYDDRAFRAWLETPATGGPR
jgi:thimet oligopeptidase